MTDIIGHFIYFTASLILAAGLFIMLTSDNYFRKIIGLNLFQSSILIFYIALGKLQNGTIPFLNSTYKFYSSPLPQVLMLTAIVVGFATLSVGLALIWLIKEKFGTISEKEVMLQHEEE